MCVGQRALLPQKMEEKGLTPDDIQGVADLHKLPFVTKADLREAYPYGLVARPLKDCVRIQSTSGTTGKRVVAFYTSTTSTCGRTAVPGLMAAGATDEDVCQVSLWLWPVHRRTRTQRRQPQRWAVSPCPPPQGNTERPDHVH